MIRKKPKNDHNFFWCAPDADGVRTVGLWISSPSAYTHGGLGHKDNESAQHFRLGEKISQIDLVLLTQTGFELWVFGSRVRCSTN